MERINADILSVGPQFRELDYRYLIVFIKKAPFFRYAPAPQDIRN